MNMPTTGTRAAFEPLSLALDHAGASVGNLERSIAFYTGVFGFVVDETFAIPGSPVRGAVLVNAGGARVELFHREGSLAAPPGHPIDSTLQQGWFQLAFSVADADLAFERVVAAGASAVKPPFRAPDGRCRVAFVGDPDGNLIELIQRGQPDVMAAAAPRPADLCSHRVDRAFALDATEPFLSDHRPAGKPLFGTAMGIDLIARAARELLALQPAGRVRLEQVHVFEPLILSCDHATADVRARLAGSRGDSGASVHCAVESRPWAKPAVPHFDALVHAAAAAAGPARLPVGLELGAPPRVRADHVYALFFHGPAFRVVRGATRVGEGMLCEWQPDLPPLTRVARDDGSPEPRWVELCLQTAGLLEVATTQRMLIPHRIDSIEHFTPLGLSRPRRLFAHAQRARQRVEGGAIDIELVDEDRNVLLRVGGYRTVPLPFRSDAAAIEALARLFGAG